MDVNLNWHFLDDEIQDLPANFRAGPKMKDIFFLPMKDDLVSFEGLPGVLFMVSVRRFAFAARANQPMELHIHLSRLSTPTA